MRTGPRVAPGPHSTRQGSPGQHPLPRTGESMPPICPLREGPVCGPRYPIPSKRARVAAFAHRRAVLLLLAALSLSARAAAQQPPSPRPTLAAPMGLGSECGLLLSCPWSGPFGVNIRLGAQLWIPGEQDPRPRAGLCGWAGLAASIWRWAELGVMFSGRLATPHEQGELRGESVVLAHPLVLWARLTPQVRDSGLAVAAEVQHHAGAAPFNG